MCDIYFHRCEDKNCANEIEMHLEDFETDHDEIQVFCGSHIPENKTDGVLWRYHPHSQKSHSRMFVRCLTENARSHWEGNCYNGECDSLLVFGKEN